MIGSGIGLDLMKPIAAQMVGGIVTSLIMELTLFPAIFYILKKREMKKTLKLEEENNDVLQSV